MRRARTGRPRPKVAFFGFLVALFLSIAQTGLIAAADDAVTDATGETVVASEDGTEASAEASPTDTSAVEATEDAPAADATIEEPSPTEESGSTDAGGSPESDGQERNTSAEAGSTVSTALAPGSGDISLDFVAAGPFTYDHETGTGGAYNDRTIDKSTGVVESLEGGDFACNELVVFFTQIEADGDVDGSNDVDIDFKWLSEPTGQPGVGFVDLVAVDKNAPDAGNENLEGNEAASIRSEGSGTLGGKDAIAAAVRVTNINANDVFILRLVVLLGCQVGAQPTGNLQAAVTDAAAGDENISVGNQTIPLKKVEDIAFPGIEVIKGCTGSAKIGEDITYTITVTNTGNEPLVNLVVNDPLLGGNLGSFPGSLGVGESVQRQFTHTVTASDPDPLTNTVTATAEGEFSQATVQDTDNCRADVIHQPGIRVTKSCPPEAGLGEEISYVITVTNTGDEPLEDLVVSDPLLGGTLGTFPATLGVGQSVTRTFTHIVTAQDPDPLTNTVTATAVGADSGATVRDTDDCVVDVIHEPGIDVTKSCTGSAKIGEDITYTITVENTGNEALENLVVSDPLLGGALTGFPNTLDVGESVTRTFTHTVTAQDPDPLTNTVTATAVGADSGATVRDVDNCLADVTHIPGIDVEKSCPDAAGIGDEITYEITVTNTGDEPLVNLVVNDPLLGGKLGTFPNTLDVGESVTRTFTHTVTAQDPDPLENTVTATAVGADSEDTVSDTANCALDVEKPAVDLQKTGGELFHRGDTSAYGFTVTNVGDVPLHDVVLVDPICDSAPVQTGFGDGDEGNVLSVDEVWTFTCGHVITLEDPDPLPNTATVSGVSPLGETVSDQDDWVVDIIHPAIDIVKTVDPKSGEPGDVVTYTYLITNIGDTTLYEVTLDDDILGHLADFEDPLEPGESVVFHADAVLGDESEIVRNIGSTAGTDVLGLTVTDEDPAVVTVVLGEREEKPPPLPPTGTDRLWLVWVALGLAVLGAASLLAARRREGEARI